LNTGLPAGSKEILMPYIGVDFTSTDPSGVYLIDIASSSFLAFAPTCTYLMPQTQTIKSCSDLPINVATTFPIDQVFNVE